MEINPTVLTISEVSGVTFGPITETRKTPQSVPGAVRTLKINCAGDNERDLHVELHGTQEALALKL